MHVYGSSSSHFAVFTFHNIHPEDLLKHTRLSSSKYRTVSCFLIDLSCTSIVEPRSSQFKLVFFWISTIWHVSLDIRNTTYIMGNNFGMCFQVATFCVLVVHFEFGLYWSLHYSYVGLYTSYYAFYASYTIVSLKEV